MVTLRIALLVLCSLVAAMGGSLQQMKWDLDRYNPPLGAVFISGEDWGGTTIATGSNPLGDKSGTGNDITTAGGYTIVDSGDTNLNACAQMNPGALRPTTDATLDVGTGDFTVSMWINTTYDATRQGLAFDGVPGASQYWFVDLNASSRLRARIFDSSTTVTTTDDGAALDDGNWHLCTIVFDRDGNMTRYVDGAPYGTADSISSATADLGFGSFNLGDVAYDDFGTEGLVGKLDDVRLYRRTLSAAEATNLYDWVAVSSTSLQAWYDFQSGTSILDDLSVQENDFTIISATYDPDGGPNGGPAYNYNGTTDYMKIDNPSFINDQQGSVACWFYFTTHSTSPFAVANNASTGKYIYWNTQLTGEYANRLRIIHYDGGYIYNIYSPSGSVPPSQWNHVVLTSDGSTLKMYINGVSVVITFNLGSNTGQWFGDLSAKNAASIGAVYYNSGTSGSKFVGTIGNLRVYSYPLSLDQVKDLYQKGAAK